MGKGSRQRPTDNEKFSANWERIFGMKEKKPEKSEPKEPDNKKNK